MIYQNHGAGADTQTGRRRTSTVIRHFNARCWGKHPIGSRREIFIVTSRECAYAPYIGHRFR